MKKLRFLLAALLTLMCANVWAQKDAEYWQSKAVSEIVSGEEYYIYSPKYNMFLSRGANWATRAVLDYQGLTWRITSSGEGVYTLYNTSRDGLANGYLFIDGENEDGWIYTDIQNTDKKSTKWTITSVGDKTYTIISNNYCLRRSDNETVISKTVSTEVNNNDVRFHWYLIPKAARENLSVATRENPVDVTYYIYNQNMDYEYREEWPESGYIRTPFATVDKGHWTESNTNVRWRGGLASNSCAEVWNSTFNISQTLTGIPNGIYRLKAQGFYRIGKNGEAGGNDASEAAKARAAGKEVINAYFYANDVEVPFPSIFANELHESKADYEWANYEINGVIYYVPTGMDHASRWFSDGYYETSLVVEVIDNTLKIGARNDVENAEQWAIFDNFRLEYLGTGTHDGFLYTEVGGKTQFLTRGYSWNTRAILGDYGVPVHLLINNGNDKIKFLDSQKYLYSESENNLYTDGNFDDVRIGMSILSDGADGYVLKAENSTSTGYVGVYDGWKLKHVAERDDALVWHIMSKTEYDKILAQRDEAGRYAGYGKAVIGSIPELSVVKNATATETNNIAEEFLNTRPLSITKSYEGIDPGLYKVSINAFYRIGTWENEFAQAQSGYNYHLAFLTANGKSVLIKSALDGKTTQAPRTGGWASQAIDGVTYYIPNDLTAAGEYFDNRYYENVIYTNVGEDRKLDISITCDEWIEACWCAYRDLEITRMDNEHLLVDINEYGASTFSSTRSYEVPDGLEAWYATSCDGSSVSMTKIENGKIPANTGVVLRGEKGQYTLTLVNDASDIDGTNLLVAVPEKVNGLAAQVGDNTNYILYNGKFCTWEETATVNVAAGKAYLSVPAASADVKNYVLDWGEADGIETVAQPVNGSSEKVFNLAGQAVGNDYKGIVIMNGKKVMKK